MSAAALWWAVVASGLYHGLSPGMGWPLAVSAAMMERRPAAMARALVALAGGHFLAMTVILLPFSAMSAAIRFDRELRVAAGLLVLAVGLGLLATRRHPRFLARVPPGRLVLWSFLAATAHGAGLMLLPIYLGLCGDPASMQGGHASAAALMAANLGLAGLVAAVHTGAMLVAGGVLAVGIYFWLGLRALSRGWFNLETAWAVSLVLVGALGVGAAVAGV